MSEMSTAEQEARAAGLLAEPVATPLLENATWDNTRVFVPPVEFGRVIKVYDGDTITVAAQLMGQLYRFSVRIKGVDTPEMKGGGKLEKQAAKLVQKQLASQIMNTNVVLKNVELEKYGRLLADVYFGPDHASDVKTWLLENNLALPYNGGAKQRLTGEEWKERVTGGAAGAGAGAGTS